MKYLENIQRGVDFIEERLDQPIEIKLVARQSGMSQWHFQRAFKALTGETLKTYIRSRRLSNSLQKLLNRDLRIIEIALDAGFESQEAYTRAFKKAFSMTPGEFRAIGEKHLFLRKVQFDEEYLSHINTSLSLTPEIIELKERIFIGAKTTYYGVESDKNNVAEKLPGLWEDFLLRLEEISNTIPGASYGIISETEGASDELNYHAATEVTNAYNIPEGLEVIELPAQKYAKFAHKGEVKKLDMTVNYIYSTWLAASDYSYANAADMEVYGPEYHPTSDQSVIYYCVPVV